MVAVTDVQLFANNRSATLNSNVAVPDGSLVLTAGQGATFPSPTAGQFFAVTVQSTLTGAYEVCYCTTRTGDILTVQRAQEGTAAQAFLSASSVVQMRLTKGTLERLIQKHFTGADVGKFLQVQASGEVTTVVGTNASRKTVGATWVRVGDPIETPVNDVAVYIKNASTIVAVSILTVGGPGSCVVDIWKDTYANYPPTVGDSIVSGSPPTITAAHKYLDTTLTGWNTAVAAGDVLMFHLVSTATFDSIFFALHLEETP